MSRGFARSLMVLIAALFLSSACFAQGGDQSELAKGPAAAPALSHDLSGMWMEYPGSGAIDEKSRPPLTPWGQSRFDATYPRLGPRAVPGKENDPSVYRCQPEGVPKVIIHPQSVQDNDFRFPAGYSFSTRNITSGAPFGTDGRPLLENPKPNWLGYSVGKWEGRHIRSRYDRSEMTSPGSIPTATRAASKCT